jgi:hypothetical protein
MLGSLFKNFFNTFHKFLIDYSDAIYKSFYSKTLYREATKNWKKQIFEYLFLMLFFCWTITFLQPLIFIAIITFLNFLPPQTPGIKGMVEFLLTVSQNSFLKTDLSSLVTHSQAMLQSQVNEYGIMASIFFSFSLLIFLLPGSFLIFAVLGFFCAAFGKIIAFIVRSNLSFFEVFKIAILALTPSIVIATIFNFFGIHLQYEFVGYFFVTLSYLIFGLTKPY